MRRPQFYSMMTTLALLAALLRCEEESTTLALPDQPSVVRGVTYGETAEPCGAWRVHYALDSTGQYIYRTGADTGTLCTLALSAEECEAFFSYVEALDIASLHGVCRRNEGCFVPSFCFHTRFVVLTLDTGDVSWNDYVPCLDSCTQYKAAFDSISTRLGLLRP
jgi:hypothetical protein